MEVEMEQPKTSRPLWQKILFLLIVLGVISLIIFGLSALFKSENKDSTNKESRSEDKKESTVSAKASTERCSPKRDLSNQKQGYIACFEASWKQKELQVSGLEIGISAKEISGEFPGTINILITDKSEDLVTQDISDNSSKFEFGKVNIAGIKSTQLVVTRQRDDPLNSYPRAVVTATSTNNRTYVFTLNSTDADFEADTKIYEDFLKTVEFDDGVDDPPWAKSRNITVNQPWPGDNISSPVAISGEAISFEAVVNIRIKDGNGKTLTESTLKTASGTDRSSFSGNVSFDKPKTSNGTVEVFTISAKDGSDQDKVSISIKFQ